MSKGALNAVGWMCAGKALLQSLPAINFPMFLLFGSPGELRNLSLLYVGFVFMLGYALNGTARSRQARTPREQPSRPGFIFRLSTNAAGGHAG